MRRARKDRLVARGARVGWTIAVLLTLGGCDGSDSVAGPGGSGGTGGPFQISADACTIDIDLLRDGGISVDGIPSLTNPTMARADDGAGGYLAPMDRVIGFLVGTTPYAVPHNILWWHEIVNLDVDGTGLAVTYCPLTGSSIVFQRSTVDGADFGVSGLLFQNNLVMYDRGSDVTLWPQMNRRGGCGPASGSPLGTYPALEMTWAGWQTLHPSTRVVTSDTGFDRTYTRLAYPYGDYERLDNRRLLDASTPIDERRPPKERVLGIPVGRGGMAFPFGELAVAGEPAAVVEVATSGGRVTVFWDAAKGAAAAYRPGNHRFDVRDGTIVDAGTGSAWSIEGVATAGTLQGTRLEPIGEAYVAFWFAWAVFQPETALWTRATGVG